MASLTSEQERVERRRAANRRSARKSRYRENIQLGELQRTVNELKERNLALKAENASFKEDVAMLQGVMSFKGFELKMVSQGMPRSTNLAHGVTRSSNTITPK